MEQQRRLTGNHIVAIVGALCAAAVLVPAGAIAAGSFVTMVDATTGSRARVDSGKVRVGDGNGALTVDGTVKTADVNAMVYRSPAGGQQCGASGSGLPLNGTEPGTFNLSRYSKLRISVESGQMNQTILTGYARSTTAATEVIKKSPVFDWTVPANSSGHLIVDNLPTLMDIRVWFCANAKIYVYGIR